MKCLRLWPIAILFLSAGSLASPAKLFNRQSGSTHYVKSHNLSSGKVSYVDCDGESGEFNAKVIKISEFDAKNCINVSEKAFHQEMSDLILKIKNIPQDTIKKVIVFLPKAIRKSSAQKLFSSFNKRLVNYRASKMVKVVLVVSRTTDTSHPLLTIKVK